MKVGQVDLVKTRGADYENYSAEQRQHRLDMIAQRAMKALRLAQQRYNQVDVEE